MTGTKERKRIKMDTEKKDTAGLESLQNKNPKAALDAICTPGSLTMGKLALLESLGSPVLKGELDDTTSNMIAVYAVGSGESPSQVLAQHKNGCLVDLALDWCDKFSPEDFMVLLGRVLDEVVAFWKMLPRPEAEDEGEGGKSKKDSASETASSPN